MANGTLKILPDSQKTYCKYAYTYGGTTYSDIHTFTTGGRTSQSIAPAISTSKVSLSELNPASVSANKVIARELGMSEFTVRVHVRNILRRLKARSRTEVVARTNALQLPPARSRGMQEAPIGVHQAR